MPKAKFIVFVIIIIFVLYSFLHNRPVSYGPGVMAPEQPIQVNLHNAKSFTYKNYTVHSLAKFEITSRVLSRKNYSSDHDSELSPLDLVLGWGPMSDESIVNKISITQSNRWYEWFTREYPIPRKEIERNSANMHLIPSHPEIKKYLDDVKRGQLVELKGYLVKITAPDKRQWRSSLSRDDTGYGACELIWVEEFNILDPKEDPDITTEIH